MFQRFLVVLLLSFSAVHAVDPYDAFNNPYDSFNNPGLTLLDEGPNTYLFRGKMPEVNGRFCYEALVEQFREILAEEGKELSKDFDLLFISLLNCSEARERRVEARWLAQNPERGRLWMYPLFGTWMNPLNFSSSFRRTVHACDIDGLQSLMVQLKEQMEIGLPDGRDLVIYIHCHAGKDRTGEASACYLMQFKGYSYNQAIYLNQMIAGRKLRRVSMNAIRWYAYYLRDVMNVDTVGAID